MKTFKRYLLVLTSLTALYTAFLVAQGPAYDILIRNGRIMDGTGNPWFSGDVSEIAGDIVSLVNASEHAAKASLCYSAGNLYSVACLIPAEYRNGLQPR